MKRLFQEPSNPILYAAASLIKRIILLPRFFRLQLVKFEGNPRNETSSFILYYIGNGEILEYLKNFYFSQVKREEIAIISILSLRKKLRQLLLLDTFIFIETNRLLDFFIPGGGLHTFPWLRQKVFLNDKSYLERKHKIEEVFGRRVRKYNYTYQITRDKYSVIKFYNELYVPYMKARYKDMSHLRSIEEFQAVVMSGFVLQVFEADKWVSGVICKLRNEEITALAFGILPEYHPHLSRGALSAVYYFIFKWAEENSIEIVDLLRSRPHAGDGVYEHKRRWGAKPDKDMWPHSSIWIFIPISSQIPSIFKKQLIWNGEDFRELQECQKNGIAGTFSKK